MKQAVMISIHPKWCELIANGKKTIEVRKTRPKIDTPFKCYIYETKGKTEYPTFIDEEGHEIYEGKGQVIGEFTCKEIATYKHERPSYFEIESWWDIDDEDLEKACLSYEQFERYEWPNHKRLYGWHIYDLVIYDKPKELSDFSLTRPPQSWCYVKEIKK